MVLPVPGGSSSGTGSYIGSGTYSYPKAPPPADDHGAHRGTTRLTGHNGDGSGQNDLKINPPLNPLADTTYYGFDARRISRGYMVGVAPTATDSGSNAIPLRQRYRFRFLYNPAELSFSNNVFTGLVAPGFRDPTDPWSGRFSGQENVSFQLMLDRTQDAYIEGVNARGTMVDIEALYRVINGGNSGDPTGNPGFMYLSEIAILFGGSNTGGRSTLPVFPGFITSLSVDHTQFTPRMVPVRTLVTLSATRLTTQSATETANAYIPGGSTSGKTPPKSAPSQAAKVFAGRAGALS